jgi:hypothetical protein
MAKITKEMLEELLPGIKVTIVTEGHVAYRFEKGDKLTELHADGELSADFRYNIANYVKKVLKSY